MKIQLLQEPNLEFGSGSHLDIKFGLMNFGPLDKNTTQAPKEIKLGMVGSNESITSLGEWIENCRKGVSAKKSPKPNLFPRFPGFGSEKVLSADLVTSTSLSRAISQSKFQELVLEGSNDKAIEDSVSLFTEETKKIIENKKADVVIIAPPLELLQSLESSNNTGRKLDFRNMLKAKMMRLKMPCQIILPSTYNSSSPIQIKGFKINLQDEATRAWNFYTALYYKAGGIPWRIKRSPSDFTTCYIGIGFYHTLDKENVETSIAQVFNERGEGIILRGGQASISKGDRRPYLKSDDAYNLLVGALERYKEEHQTLPARVVIHKTSEFKLSEISGFSKAIKEKGIALSDFVSIFGSSTKLLRTDAYPPLRGTFLELDDKTNILYTRGSVNFYQTYPGPYIPVPLGFRCDKVDQSSRQIAEEILVLTKMNWNNTNFDNSNPITIVAARKVGEVLKYINSAEDVEARYSYYI